MKKKERNKIKREIAKYHMGNFPVERNSILLHHVCELYGHYLKKYQQVKLNNRKSWQAGYDTAITKDLADYIKYLNKDGQKIDIIVSENTTLRRKLRDLQVGGIAGRTDRLHFDEVAHPGTPMSDAVSEIPTVKEALSSGALSYVPRVKDTVRMREQLTELGYGRTAWNGDRKWTVHIFGVTDKTEGFMYRQSWFDTELEAYHVALNIVT